MVGKEWLGWSQHVRRFLGEEEGQAAVLGLLFMGFLVLCVLNLVLGNFGLKTASTKMCLFWVNETDTFFFHFIQVFFIKLKYTTVFI
jgi:hypothetical protein